MNNPAITPVYAIKTDFGNSQANEVWEAIKTYSLSGIVAALNLGTDQATDLVHQHTIDGHDLLAKFLVLVSALP